MKKSVRLDFETRSELDVRDVGAYLYAKHSSTQVVCFTYQIDDGPTYLWHRFSGKPIPSRLINALKTRKLEAHNAFFEYCIWNFTLCREYVACPVLPFLHYDCSAAKAAAMALPRDLKNLCIVLDTSTKKDEDGKRVMMKVAKPRRPTKKDPTSKWHESAKDLNTLFRYNIDDVRAEAAASHIMRPLTPQQHKVWEIDQKMNLRGVLCDRKGVEAALSLLGEYEDKLTTELRLITGGEVNSAGALKQITGFLERNGVLVPDLQKQTVDDFLKHQDNMNPIARRVLEIRQKLGRASTKKYQAMQDRMSPEDDRIRDILLYHGASTGRWAGRGIQLQNLPRGIGIDQNTCIEFMYMKDLDFFEAMYDDVLGAISSCVRGMLIAGRGKVLRSIDYSAIEARVLAWLVGEEWVLKIFRTTGKIYEATAGSIYKVPASSIVKSDPRRQIGKVADLALGYQGGVGAFQTMAVNYGVVVSDAEAEKIKTAWRLAHPKTVKFWADLQNAAINCVRTKRTQRVGRIEFNYSGRTMRITLPSGRDLYYWDPHIHEGKWGKDEFRCSYVDSQTRKWVTGALYGGLFCENITQAVAADLLTETMVRFEDNGYTNIFSVHDEGVTEDDLKFGSLKEMKEIMLDASDWADGLPLEAEGWEDYRYKK